MIFYYSGQEIIWTKFAKRYLRVCFTFTPNHTSIECFRISYVYYDWTSDHAWRFQNFGASFLFWFELSESPITYLDVLSVYLSCHARNQSSCQLIIFRNFRDQSCKNTIVCVYLNSTFRDSVFFFYFLKKELITNIWESLCAIIASCSLVIVCLFIIQSSNFRNFQLFREIYGKILMDWFTLQEWQG